MNMLAGLYPAEGHTHFGYLLKMTTEYPANSHAMHVADNHESMKRVKARATIVTGDWQPDCSNGCVSQNKHKEP